MSSKTDVVVILDRSGSMQSAAEDHVGGLRSFVEDQKSIDGDVFFTFVRFDSNDPFEIVFDRANIMDIDVNNLSLTPRGGTPLLDAFGSTIEHLEKTIPIDTNSVLVMVISDSLENASRKFTRDQIKKMVEDKKDKWTFMYLGANIDSFAEAANFGVNKDFVANFDNSQNSVRNTYSLLSDKVKRTRGMYNKAIDNGEDIPMASCNAVYAFNDDEKKSMKTGN